MSLLIIRLLTFLNGQTIDSTNYHIALTMVNHYKEVQTSSIGEIAKLCAVSKSTISKFARTLGFDDYLDLKDNATLVEDRFNNPLNYLSNILTSIEREGFDQYFDAVIKDITYFKNHLDIHSIDRIAQAIADHEEVVTFGLIFSESAAVDFQYKLAYNGKYLRTFQDDLVQEEFLKQATEDTLIILFTNSGNYLTKQQIRLGTPKKNIFSQTKAKIIVVTSNPQVAQLPFVEETLVFPHQTDYQTHAVLYPIITDLIVSRFRSINRVARKVP